MRPLADKGTAFLRRIFKGYWLYYQTDSSDSKIRRKI